MRNSRETRDKRPVLPKVERVDLSDKHIPLRVIGILLFLCIGIGAFVYGIRSLTATEEGWTAVEVDTSAGLTVGNELVLSYELGASEMSPGAELKAVRQAYTDAALTATRLFDTGAEESYGGIARLNAHPGQTVTLNEDFYKALERLGEDRTLYLGALAGDINSLLLYESEEDRAALDPAQNEDQRAWCARVAAFAKDPDHIRIDLLGNNQARLVLSAAYADFAKTYEITTYVDLLYMKNAFAVDYIADALTSAGFTNGSLSSLDGYVRRMDERDYSMSYNLFDYRQKKGPAAAGRYDYTHPSALVCLRAFPVNETEHIYARVMEDGTFRNRYISPEDGQSRTAVNTLLAIKEGGSCAELLLRAKELFILPAETHPDMNDCTLILCDGRNIRTNRVPCPLKEVPEEYGVPLIFQNE